MDRDVLDMVLQDLIIEMAERYGASRTLSLLSCSIAAVGLKSFGYPLKEEFFKVADETVRDAVEKLGAVIAMEERDSDGTTQH